MVVVRGIASWRPRVSSKAEIPCPKGFIVMDGSFQRSIWLNSVILPEDGIRIVPLVSAKFL
jgi:hypothetical protein